MGKLSNVCRAVFSVAFAALVCSGCVAMKKDVEQLSKRCDAIKDALNEERRKDVEQLSKRCDAIKDALNEQLRKDVERLSKQSNAIKNEMKDEILASSSRNSRALKEGLSQVSRDNKECIARALQAEYEIKSNSTYAKEALKLAEAAIARNDYSLAKVYLLNAVNHMPYEIKYIELYNTLMVKQARATAADLKRFIDILDVAVYQVAPDSVSKIVGFRNDAVKKMNELEQRESDAESASYRRNLAKTFEQLDEGSLSWERINQPDGRVDLRLLERRIEAERKILEEGMVDEQKAQMLSADLDRAKTVYQVAAVLASVDNAIQKSKAIVERQTTVQKDLVLAQNQLQTAVSLLSQVWTLDCRGAEKQLKRAENFQVEISKIDSAVKMLSSLPKYNEIIKLFGEIDDVYNEAQENQNDRTGKIKKITEKIVLIQRSVLEVSFPEFQENIRDKMKVALEKVQGLQKARYQAYQEWALEQLRECHKEFKSKTIVTDAEGDSMFENYLLKINPALLSPDVQSLYNSVYQKVYAEVTDKAATQIKKAETKCQSLEDF